MKKLISLLLALTMVVCSFSFTVAAADVVEIATADQLKALAQTIADDASAGEGKTYKLTADIDLGNAEWSTYIGNITKPFMGTFDGDGHIIKNFKLTIPNSNVQGAVDYDRGSALFGYISGNAVIKNLGVENIVIGSAINSWKECAGGIAGIVDGNAKITDCFAKNITCTDTASPDVMSIGGIASAVVSSGVVIENCYTTGMNFQTGVDYDAGLIGTIKTSASIINCYTTKTISRMYNPATNPLTAEQKTAIKNAVVNSYYVETAPWPTEDYVGSQVTTNALKGMAETLGEGFMADSEDFPSNNGYPVLKWEENTKVLEGDALIESASPTNDVPLRYATIEVVFDKMLDASTIDEYSVLVDKDVDYSIVTDGEYTDEISIVFTELDKRTNYTITFTTDIVTYAGYTVADGQSVTFKTGVGFSNMVENADMEDTTNKSVFTDKNGGNNITFAKDMEIAPGVTSTALSLSPSWADQPVALAGVSLAPGSYYMGAWVMSPEGMRITLALSDEASNWANASCTLEAGKWTYVENTFDVGFDVSQVSIRAKDKTTMYVDNWCLYDLSKAAGSYTTLISSSITDRTEDVSPFGFSFELLFSGELKPSSLINGVTLSNDVDLVFDYSANDATKITFKAIGDLALGTTYTISFEGLEDMAGNAVYIAPITFTTFAEPAQDTVVVSTTPAANATGISTSISEILINFDSPIDETTISGITVIPSIAKEIKLSAGNQITVVVDSSKVEFDTEYTVNVPSTVKTIQTNSGVSFSAVPYEFSFTTITEADVIADVNTAIGDKDAMKIAIESAYALLSETSSVYEYVLTELPEKEDELYTTLASISTLNSVADLQYALNSASLDIVLDNVTDSSIVVELLENGAGLMTSGLQFVFNQYVGTDSQVAIAEKAIAMKDESFDTIKSAVVLDTIKAAFKNTSGATAIGSILKSISSCLTGANAIDTLIAQAEANDPDRIYGELQNLPVTSLSDIKTALTSAVAKYTDSGNGGSSTGGSGGGSSSVKKPGAGAAGFIPAMPNSTGTTTVNSAVFNDLTSVSWAVTSIENLYNKGIINGKSNGVFDPEGLVTRKEFAKIAVLAVGGYDANATASFADLGADDWSYSYVASAYNLGLINGIGEGKFGGDQYITREEMATILSRMVKAIGLEASVKPLYFTDDSEIADYAKEPVSLLSALGIVNGTGDGKFEPKGNATRAQAAVIFDRFLAESGK